MKKSDKEKRTSGREKELPDSDEMRGASLNATYGEDSMNDLMWDMDEARTHAEYCEMRSPEKPLIPAMIAAAQERGPNASPETILPPFYESVTIALLECDANFFREVARLLETRIAAPPERRVDLEVVRAFNFLRALAAWRREPLPTKKTVRETALRAIGFANVMHRRGIQHPAETMRSTAGTYNWWARLKPEILREVEAEIERLPEQNWTVIFKRCGLADLPNDKGGQRSHRKRR